MVGGGTQIPTTGSGPCVSIFLKAVLALPCITGSRSLIVVSS